jgi:hypothetical protein
MRASLNWKRWYLLTKSNIIAHCLVNSKMLGRLEDADQAVRQTFLDEFPDSNFTEWNQEINDKTAENIIRNVGRASRINVKKFIEELW